MISKSALKSLFVLVISFSFALWAQDSGNEEGELFQTEIIVTAEKREEPLHKTPMAISVMTGEVFEKSGIESIEKAALYVPNLYLAGFHAKRTSYPFIRGIGAGQGDPAVTTYIDGVPQLFGDTNMIDLVDIERMEVLKGPQGTLYGRNTIGGLIHYISRKPDNDFGFGVTLGAGSDNYERQTLTVDGPIVKDKVWYSLAAARTLRDGYTVDAFSGNDVDYRDGFFGRVKLLFKPADSWEIRLNAHGQRDRDGGFVLYSLNELASSPYEIASDVEGFSNRDLESTSLDVTWRGTRFDVQGVVAFGSWDADEQSDVDFTILPIVTRDTIEDQEQVFAEVRLISAEPLALGSARLDWVLGASFFDSSFQHFSSNQVNRGVVQREDALYNLDDDGLGIYGHGTLTFADHYDLVLGGRYVQETKNTRLDLTSDLVPEPLNVTKTSFRDDFSQFLPRFGFSYQQDNWSVFAAVAKSYRSGGYNRNEAASGPASGVDDEIYRVEEETGWNYEIGAKGAFADGRVYLAGSLYHIDWKNRQLSVPSTAIPGRFFLDNVVDSTSDGIELEVAARINDYWDVSTGLGISNAVFEEYIDPNTGENLAGKDLPNAPQNTFNFVVDGHTPLFAGIKGWVRTEMVRYGEIYWENSNETSQVPYTLVNVRTGLERSGFRLEFWVDNLTQTDYISTAIPGIFSFVGGNGMDRQTGLTLGYRY